MPSSLHQTAHHASFGKPHRYTLQGEQLRLLPQKALFWERKQALIIADAHLGKSGHFRKNGMALPNGVTQHDIARMEALVAHLQPQKVLFLGDLFHSEYNREWNLMGECIAAHPAIDWMLVKGNHDFLPSARYAALGLEVFEKYWEAAPFCFRHEPPEDAQKVPISKGLYTLSGHIHPGLRMNGPARQRFRLPAFVFGNAWGVLPAFGSFTGLSTQAAFMEGQKCFGIAEDVVLPLG